MAASEYYKPLPIFVLDPIELLAMSLVMQRKKNGIERWKACLAETKNHPDWQKLAVVAHGALIYAALFPERTHADHRPPEAWLKEAGITEASLADARKQFRDADSEWDAKQQTRRQVYEAMDDY